MIETRAEKVSPRQEQSVINLLANFGWTLQSSQEINNTDSHLERRGDDIYNVTTKENYVKLVFQRDTNMPNYARLSSLEKNYFSLLAGEPDAPNGLSIGVAFILLLLYVLPGVIYIAVKIKKKKEYEAAYAAWKKKMNTQGKSILEEAATLLV